MERVEFSPSGGNGTERNFFRRSRGWGVSRLRARPMGSAPWNPAAFEKAGETFSCAPRSPVQTLIRIS